jgi:hypothetical protein
MSARFNFSNMWIGLLDRKNYTWKIHETQSPTYQMLNNKIEKQINYIKWYEVKKNGDQTNEGENQNKK